jgi:hypothetical protein
MIEMIEAYIQGIENARRQSGYNAAICEEDTMYGGQTLDEEIKLAKEKLERAKADLQMEQKGE